MKRSHNDEPGHGIVEYALILVLVLVIAIIALVLAGPSLEEFFNNLLGELAPP
ncbi:MAG: Flp family type IVb pilin [Chloroflexota bacterium]|nr:Flp family type IVb pilin [Chloroflexota bacterium]MDE2635213.1 Flp family type IVb pilin [Chloroflexota bacterium]MYE27312.1 Flp family type IVb pilin [Chloroflexota bacterium]